MDAARTFAGLLALTLIALALRTPPAAAGDPVAGWPASFNRAHTTELLSTMNIDSKPDSDDGTLIVTWIRKPETVPGVLEVRAIGTTGSVSYLQAIALIPASMTRYLSRRELAAFGQEWSRRQPIGRELVLSSGGIFALQDMLIPKTGVAIDLAFKNEIGEFQTALKGLIADLDRESKLHAEEGEKAYSEDWELSDPSKLPGRAVGLLETREGYLCTASLVAEDVILTAAHCVLDEGRVHQRPERFSAGYDHGDAVATAGILSVYVSPDYDPDRDVNPSDPGSAPSDLDWAFLRLDQPIGRQTGTLEVLRLDQPALERLSENENATVIQIGYGGGARRPKLRHDCLPGEVESEDQYSTQCGLEKGDSGSPVLLLQKDQYRIIGVNYAWANSEFVNHASFAVGSAAFDKPLRDFISGELAAVPIKDWMANPAAQEETGAAGKATSLR